MWDNLTYYLYFPFHSMIIRDQTLCGYSFQQQNIFLVRENILVIALVLLLRKLVVFTKKNKPWMELEDAYFASLWMNGRIQETLFKRPFVEVSTLFTQIPSAAAEVLFPTFLFQTFPLTSGQEFTNSLTKMTSELSNLHNSALLLLWHRFCPSNNTNMPLEGMRLIETLNCSLYI